MAHIHFLILLIEAPLRLSVVPGGEVGGDNLEAVARHIDGARRGPCFGGAVTGRSLKAGFQTAGLLQFGAGLVEDGTCRRLCRCEAVAQRQDEGNG